MFKKIRNFFRDRRSRHDSHHRSRSAIFDVVLGIITFPIRVLFYPVEAVFKSLYRPDVYDDGMGRTRKKGFFPATWFWIKRVGWELLLVPIRLLKSPFVFFQALARENRTDVLYVLPALAMIGFFGFVFYQVFGRSSTIENRYNRGAQNALAAGDYKLAKTYFSRIASDGELSNPEQFQWAIVLGQTGEPERAEQVLDALAPDDAKRYGPAHRLKALNLAAQVSGTTAGSADPLLLKNLRSHLENCGENSNEINQSWAIYYLAVDDTDKALGYLRSAAENDPRFLLTIAEINQRNGHTELRDQAILKADSEFRKLVEKDPLDVGSRVALANILLRQQKIEEAESMLLTGLKLQPDPVLRRETAGFYLLKQGLMAAAKAPFSEQFAMIQNAISLDENFPPIYERIQALNDQITDKDERVKIKDALYKTVTGDKPSAVAHLTLSNVLWAEGDKEEAEYHLEQAYKLDTKFAIVINNLAWMLCKKDPPELDRAEELIKLIYADSPNDYRFIDTYAHIMMGQKRWEEAITFFQRALPNSTEKKEIHAMLAACYQELGKTTLAELHRKQAEE